MLACRSQPPPRTPSNTSKVFTGNTERSESPRAYPINRPTREPLFTTEDARMPPEVSPSKTERTEWPTAYRTDHPTTVPFSADPSIPPEVSTSKMESSESARAHPTDHPTREASFTTEHTRILPEVSTSKTRWSESPSAHPTDYPTRDPYFTREDPSITPEMSTSKTGSPRGPKAYRTEHPMTVPFSTSRDPSIPPEVSTSMTERSGWASRYPRDHSKTVPFSTSENPIIPQEVSTSKTERSTWPSARPTEHPTTVPFSTTEDRSIPPETSTSKAERPRGPKKYPTEHPTTVPFSSSKDPSISPEVSTSMTERSGWASTFPTGHPKTVPFSTSENPSIPPEVSTRKTERSSRPTAHSPDLPTTVAFSTSKDPSIPQEASTSKMERPSWPTAHPTEHPTTVPFSTTEHRSILPGTGECDDKICKRPQCVCASDAPPSGLRVDEMPQFVMLTFNGAVNALNMAFYRELLENSKRMNKQNGCAIVATFFVCGDYLDYEAVNQLHSWGNEIALHTISHQRNSSYWQTINSTQWKREVLDQRAMLTAFANVPASDVIGFRGPFLFTGGDEGFMMLYKHLRYDSTLVHPRVRAELPVYPYTMDFGFRRSCNVLPCPQGSYPGLWEVPINVFFPTPSTGDVPCAVAEGCLPQPVTANDTFEYFKSNFDQFYTTNRAPFPVFLHEGYLRHPERKAGYLRFVDWLLEKDDVHLVTVSEVLRFMENPKRLSEYQKRPCTGRNDRGTSTCPRPMTCSYKNTPPGGERYMRTCSVCPKNYPWVNNPLGN